ILWDHAYDGITITDPEGRILQANHRFAEMMGYGEDEIEELYLEDVIHPEDLEMVRERHLLRLSGGDSPSTYTARCVRKDGSVIHLQTTSSVIRKVAGSEVSLDIIRDITRQVQAEKELQERNVLLTESNRRYQDLLDFMTHELKNPLTMLRAYSELLVDGAGGRLTRKGQRIALNLWRGANRMESLISTYLHLSHIEGGGVVMNCVTSLFIKDVVNWASEFLSIQLEASEMKITVDPDGLEDVEVWADRELLRTAVQNILSNAIKYGYKGSPIMIHLSETGSSVTASFFNEGIGIAVDHLEDVFKKYSRVHARGDNPLRSSGIGLYLVKRIMEEHGGKVSMRSKEGEWAEAVITLPK
ncbi:MAG: PAS domain-containing sensor histidine kinase, partial [Deltaproteobacteria bacterium]|nr:PAS domain-containing sensor histidine kinase [Deltaproteobacteria bacterium]